MVSCHSRNLQVNLYGKNGLDDGDEDDVDSIEIKIRITGDESEGEDEDDFEDYDDWDDHDDDDFKIIFTEEGERNITS